MKRIPYFQSVRVALGASAEDKSNKVTADQNRRIHIEQIVADVRKTSDLSVTDAQVQVDINDKTNASYTKGYVPVASLAGKATTGIPRFLPMKLVIEPQADLYFYLKDLSAQANTVDLLLIGYEEIG